MADDRVSPGVPATLSPDDVAVLETVAPPSGNGFLVDDPHGPSLDGEQLFRQELTSAPPPPHAPTETYPLEPATSDGSTPAGNAVLLASGQQDKRDRQAAGFKADLGSPARLKREQVVDRWDCLIAGGHGRGDAIVDATLDRIDQQQLPFVSYKQRALAASLLRGGTRPFLIVTHDNNGRLRPYRMHVNVRDYGQNLQTSWFLTYHLGFFEKLKPDPLVRLNLFDEQDLRAYVTAVHHCFLDSVVDLMVALGQDGSKIERNSKGFLGIS
jgi:hypothetical protein